MEGQFFPVSEVRSNLCPSSIHSQSWQTIVLCWYQTQWIGPSLPNQSYILTLLTPSKLLYFNLSKSGLSFPKFLFDHLLSAIACLVFLNWSYNDLSSAWVTITEMNVLFVQSESDSAIPLVRLHLNSKIFLWPSPQQAISVVVPIGVSWPLYTRSWFHICSSSHIFGDHLFYQPSLIRLNIKTHYIAYPSNFEKFPDDMQLLWSDRFFDFLTECH